MITEKLLYAMKQWPDRVACRVGEESVTYRELLLQASELAGLLGRQGNSPVILHGNHSIPMMTALVACLLAKRAYVPVGSNVPVKRLREIVRLSGAALVLRLGETGTGEDLLDADGLKSLPGQNCADCLPDGTAELTLSELSRFRDCAQIESNNQIAYIIFTSGSTGTPKGVPVSYENLSNFAAWIGEMEPFRDYEGIAVLNQAPLGFDLSVCDVYYALCGGHTWTAVPGGFANLQGGITEVFRRNRVGVAALTPSALKMCLVEETFSAAHLPELRAVFCCGERLEKKPVRKLFARFPEICLINAYGPSEATCAVCAVRITKEMLAADEELPVGRTDTAATEVAIEDGEIVLFGPSVFGGYLDGREGGHFTKDGRNGYRTGDFGLVRDDLLYFLGRKDSQVKYKGYRIELEEIERAILKLSGVAECAVIAKRNGDGIVKTLQAYVVSEPGGADGTVPAGTDGQRQGSFFTHDSKLTAGAVKKALTEVLPSYMIPKTVTVTESLPHNKNGKIDRKALELL